MTRIAQRSIERVTFERLVKTFGATAALRGVSGVVRAGELTMIEGANGSGKTTLLRILGTIMRPSAGSVRYEPQGDDPAEVRRHVGWLSHEPLAYADLSGRQNVELAAAAHGLERIETWTAARERFELGRFADRPLRTNSRGQRQRIALARALVHRPSLVLLDEPTTGLDRAGVRRLVDLVAEEVAAGAAVVVVSHEPAIFAELAAARIALDRGRRVEAAADAAG